MQNQGLAYAPARAPSKPILSWKLFTEHGFVILFLLGAVVCLGGIWRPIDTLSWRESDIAGIARNYLREGMNLIYPRVDWRGDGPGFAEMEFPLYPWLIAALYKIFGVHEQIGRFVSYSCALGSMAVFILLARRLLPRTGALAACLFFVLSPLVNYIAIAIRPEGLMFFFCLTAVYSFVRWVDDDSTLHYAIALGASAMAILAKLPAAHIGLLFAFLVLNRWGMRALRDRRMWVFAIGALLPAVLWYIHARNLWLVFGNSLGVSNKYHWAGWDLFTNPYFISGVLRTEWVQVWAGAAFIVAVAGLILRRTSKSVWLGVAWLAAVYTYYALTARTTAASWAYYYHITSVPPAALLVGAGVDAIRGLLLPAFYWVRTTLAAGGIAAALTVAAVAAGETRSQLLLEAAVVFWIAALLSATLFRQKHQEYRPVGANWPVPLKGVTAAVVLLALSVTFTRQILHRQRTIHVKPHALRECARTFAEVVPSTALIVASGGPCTDETGYTLGAYNAPYMFYWMDRKGFNVCQQQQSIDTLQTLMGRGAKYFVAEKGALATQGGFEAELGRSFKKLAACPDALLFELGSQGSVQTSSAMSRWPEIAR